MKFAAPASSISSILLIAAFFLVGACEDIKLRDPFAPDQVPPEVRAAPRLVTVPPPLDENTPWPLVGNVPFKPNDFSPKPTYDHYMNELEYHRAEAETIKREASEEDLAAPNVAAQNPIPTLAPPQLPPSKE